MGGGNTAANVTLLGRVEELERKAEVSEEVGANLRHRVAELEGQVLPADRPVEPTPGR